MTSLGERLEAVEAPDAAGARDRTWEAVADAYAARRVPRRRAGRRAVSLGVALALLVAAVAAASSSPGVAVRDWVVRVLGGGAPPAPRAALGPLPDGRMLVTSPRGAWTVGPDGARRLLGSYRSASWSPRGRFVAAWRGRELSAVAPDGRVAWRMRTIGEVDDARWSPDGFRIAYRRAGGIGVVAGDGTGARALVARSGPAAPAWRPGAPHTLAWVDGVGRVVVRDVDTRRLVWRSPVRVGATRDLAWSSDGRLLLVRGGGGLRLADVVTGRVERVSVPRGERVTAAVWAPRGRRVAVVVRRGTVSRVRVGVATSPLSGAEIFGTTGRLTSVAWSPDARRVLVRWPEADEWLLLPATGRGRITAIAPVARRFGGAPTVRGWCCARR